ncbi:MAG: AraC family transcriptional regulator [Comamonadaceae bacterium]|nr:MAG: AraC family transcriptional regulator [Comamonadaceae bacterium]
MASYRLAVSSARPVASGAAPHHATGSMTSTAPHLPASTSLHRLAGRLPMATSHAGTPGDLHELSTDLVAPADRFAFIRRMNLDRMDMTQMPGDDGVFEMRMRRIFGRDTHIMETIGTPLCAARSREQALRDGVDYISLNVVAEGRNFVVDHHGHVHRLRAGMAFLVDSAEPVAFSVQRHRMVSLFLPRFKVMDALGRIPERLPDAVAGGTGLGAVVAAQLCTVAAEAHRLTPPQRIAMVGACTDTVLAALVAAAGDAPASPVDSRVYLAACRLIRERCADTSFRPGDLAQALRCSRATLYRAFAAHQEGVASRIREARLTLARNMIESRRHAGLTLGEIAFRCGFLDQSAFNRTFRRRHGLTPGEARAALLESPAADT